MPKIGKNILENLTTAMYENIQIIYREYIQNSADSIDEAIVTGILKKEDACINIRIETSERKILIHDNGTGISKELFKETLLNIADSDKDRKTRKGFRGIGRLGGLAYCDKLIFTSSSKGEKVKSILEWDAKKLKRILNDPNQRPEASSLIDEITSFKEEKYNEDEHFFEVSLVDITTESCELLNIEKVQEYLEFVAPVPYKNTFRLRSKIYNYIKEHNFKMDEYKILINADQLFKPYTKTLLDKKNQPYDTIEDLSFKEFFSDKGELLAWMWYGVSAFKTQIPPNNKARGMRLRKENIQIGDSETFSNTKIFKEKRSNHYFVGEIFATHQDLIPNARRDYFNLNEPCHNFESNLKEFCFNYLSKIYPDANDIKNILEKISDGVLPESEIKKLQKKLDKMEDKAKEDTNIKIILDAYKKEYADKPKQVQEKQNKPKVTPQPTSLKEIIPPSTTPVNTPSSVSSTEKVTSSSSKTTTKTSATSLPTPSVSLTTSSEQHDKTVLDKVYAIIRRIIKKEDLAEAIIAKIQKELNK